MTKLVGCLIYCCLLWCISAGEMGGDVSDLLAPSVAADSHVCCTGHERCGGILVMDHCNSKGNCDWDCDGASTIEEPECGCVGVEACLKAFMQDEESCDDKDICDWVCGTDGTPTGPSLFDQLGGFYGLSSVFELYTPLLYDDPVLQANPRVASYMTDEARAVRLPGFRGLLTEQAAEATGGTSTYSGLPMDVVHADMAITNEEFNHFMNITGTFLLGLGIPVELVTPLAAFYESLRGDIVTA